MGKVLAIFISMALVGGPSMAQEPGAGSGRIIVYRGSSVMGAGIACPVRYKGKDVVELGRGKYAEMIVPAGDYILTNRTASVEVRVSADQTRYVRCQIKTGMMTGRADLQIVDAESFDEHRKDLEKKELLSNPFAKEP
jgi:hypothetical protein